MDWKTFSVKLHPRLVAAHGKPNDFIEFYFLTPAGDPDFEFMSHWTEFAIPGFALRTRAANMGEYAASGCTKVCVGITPMAVGGMSLLHAYEMNLHHVLFPQDGGSWEFFWQKAGPTAEILRWYRDASREAETQPFVVASTDGSADA